MNRDGRGTRCGQGRSPYCWMLAGLCASYPAIADAVQSGTGFAVGDGSSVITNFHVVDGCKSVHIVNVGDGLIKTVDPGNDIAIIQSARPISRPLRLRTGEPLQPGEDIIVIGFPLRGLLSSAPTVTTGIVSSLAGLRDDRTRFQISAPVQPGNSGGPVLDKAGNVVGMVVSKLNVLRIARMTGDIPQNVNFAIPASIITSVLDANSVKYQTGTSDGGKSTAEIVSAASPGVVSLECLGRERGVATADVPAVPSPAALGAYGAIAWDRETGRRGWSWNQHTQMRADETGAERMRCHRLQGHHARGPRDVRRAGDDRSRKICRRCLAQGSRCCPARRPKRLREGQCRRVHCAFHRMQQMTRRRAALREAA